MKKLSKKAKIILATGVAAFLLVQQAATGYFFSFGPFKSLGDIRMAQIPGNDEKYDMASVEALADSPLEGKNVLFLGSSVTYGSASIRQGIPEYFAARMGCNYTKESVSGTTLVDNGSNSYIQRLLNKVDANEKYDLLICQLSTNDASKKMPLGEISESLDLEDFDASTITGAMEYIICYAKKTWNCKVAFYTGSRYDSVVYEAMVTRLMELQEKWDIGILDLWSSEDFNAISDEQRALYMNDNVHPTKAGYREWWCPELERQLIAYLLQ